MTSMPMIRFHDVEKDLVTDREMTAEEFAQYQSEVSAIQALFDKNKVNEA
jgi:hypothetical protein